MTLDNFPRWYELAVLAPKAAAMAHRQQAIEAHVASIASQDQVLDLVGAAFWTDRAGNAAGLRAAVRARDPFFPLRGRAFELQVVAASGLIRLLEVPSRLSSLAALVSAGPLFAGVTPPFTDLKIAVASYLDAQPVAARAAAWGKSSDRFRETPQSLPGQAPTASQMEALSEESDVIWWLHHKPAREQDPIVLAAELASRTRFLPGLYRAREFLADALGRSRASAHADDLSSYSLPPLTAHIFSRVRADDANYFPVHSCLAQQLELSMLVSRVDIAEQAYRECLALLVIGGD
jgi:hypothetical protein